MNASIRLVAVGLLALLSLLSSACVAATRAGAPAPRLVREPMIGLDEGARPAGPPSLQVRLPERMHTSFSWSVSNAR